MELPIVTTSVAAAGLRIDGQDAPLYVGDGAEQFAQRTLELLRSPEEQIRLAAASRQFAEKYFDWAHSTRQLEKMCFDAVAQFEEDTQADIEAQNQDFCCKHLVRRDLLACTQLPFNQPPATQVEYR